LEKLLASSLPRGRAHVGRPLVERHMWRMESRLLEYRRLLE